MDKELLTKTVIEKNSFVLCRKFPNSFGIVTTFKKENNKFHSDLILPSHKQYRINEIKKMIPQISSIDTVDEQIYFDCINTIDQNTDIFRQNPDLENGLIHFDLLVKHIKNPNGETESYICEVRARLMIKNAPSYLGSFEIEGNKFKTDKIKVFSFIMVKGFMVCVSDSEKTRLKMIISKPKEKYVGSFISSGNRKMFNNIRYIWPIFNYDFKKNISISLKDGILDNQKSNHPIYIELERDFNSNKVHIKKLGKSIYVDSYT